MKIGTILTKNRKAQLGATITLIVAIIIIFFILTIFYYLSSSVAGLKFKRHADIFLSYADKEQALVSLKSFLITPVEIKLEGTQTTLAISDLIRINEDGIYNAVLGQKASEIFKPFGKCYFFKADRLKIGNSKYEAEKAIATLPISPGEIIEISLAINSKCLWNLK